MDNKYAPHDLQWTDEKVARFWNFHNNYKPYDGTWFTEAIGTELLRYTNSQVPVKGKVLDYGTGKGFLLKQLMDGYPGIELYACDFTEDLAKGTGERYKDYPAFKGCTLLTGLPSAYENDFFDMVFLVETIEHLTDNYLHTTLQEIHRILKPGGHIVITTPNNENIQKKYVHCADCGATFHHMQHVRSWNVKSLTSIMTEFRFAAKSCNELNLKWYKEKGGFIYKLADQLKKKITGDVWLENLIYIGRK